MERTRKSSFFSCLGFGNTRKYVAAIQGCYDGILEVLCATNTHANVAISKDKERKNESTN